VLSLPRQSVSETTMYSIVLDIIKTCRPHQWVKNLFVLAPLFFAGQLFIPTKVLMGVIGALIFSLLSSAVYFINDTLDREDDARHQNKKHRPIAAGRISVKLAIGCAMLLCIGSLFAAFITNIQFGYVCTSYFIINIAYSVILKQLFLVDIIIIAVGFLIRVYAGSSVSRVPVSPWILSCTFFLALFLALGKRVSEVRSRSSESKASSRRKLENYTEVWTIPAMWSLLGVIITLYTVYCVHPTQRSLYTTEILSERHLSALSTVPFVVFGLGRFLYIALSSSSAESPTERILKDKISILNNILWILLSSIRYLPSIP